MLKRKITDVLINWKNNKKNECLLIKGARQIGKTYIIENFGKNYYKSYIYINFFTHPNLKEIFSDELSAEEIYKKMSAFIKNIEFIENDTLIFLDEIQECPNARTALKFLAIDNRYDVIASGSLLGINYKDIKSIPVGYEKQIEMYALDFEEFLWAVGVNEKAIDYIRDHYKKKEKVDDAVNKQFLKYLREYIVVGGMPEVVNSFVEKNNYNDVYSVQNKILNDYLDDIAKYADMSDKPKVRNCFLSIPRQLAKENKKFQFSVVEKGGRARKYENSLDWLRDANLIRYCYNVTTPTFPLVGYEIPEQYKVYLNDIGLLTAMFGFDIKESILTNSLVGNVKGGIYENLIADIFIKKGKKLNYYKKINSEQEIEFLINEGVNIIPVEVKAGNNHTASLNSYIEHQKPIKTYKLINGNIGVLNEKITLPLYMAMFI